MNGLSLITLSSTFYGDGGGADAGAAGGEGGGAEGDGTGDGAEEGEGEGEGDAAAEGDALGDGDPLGVSLGDAVGDGEPEGGPGVQPWVPLRKISWACAPQPWTIPGGCAYQSCMFAGSALMKRAITVEATLSPNAWISWPPPSGAVFPTQTPTTMLGL